MIIMGELECAQTYDAAGARRVRAHGPTATCYARARTKLVRGVSHGVSRGVSRGVGPRFHGRSGPGGRAGGPATPEELALLKKISSSLDGVEHAIMTQAKQALKEENLYSNYNFFQKGNLAHGLGL